METQEFWEQHYGRHERVWSGAPNALLAEIVSGLPPGCALDLGCGEGADAVWLARQGWQVTAVDVSRLALERARALAEQTKTLDRVRFEAHDLTQSFPDGSFDLVSAQFFQSPLALPRDVVFRQAVASLTPEGLLLLVDHGSAPAWAGSQQHHEEHRFPTVGELVEGLALDPEMCRIEVAEAREREAVGPDGERATVLDNVIMIRRTP